MKYQQGIPIPPWEHEGRHYEVVVDPNTSLVGVVSQANEIIIPLEYSIYGGYTKQEIIRFKKGDEVFILTVEGKLILDRNISSVNIT